MRILSCDLNGPSLIITNKLTPINVFGTYILITAIKNIKILSHSQQLFHIKELQNNLPRAYN